MKLSKIYLSLLLSCILAIAGCDKNENSPSQSNNTPQPTTTAKESELPEGVADQAATKALPPKTPPTTTTESTLEPVPVPTAQPPKATQTTPDPDSSDNGTAIAKNYTTPDISNQVIPYLMANQSNLNACQEFVFDPDLAQTGSNVYRLNEKTYLAHFVCAAAAYQPLQEYYLYEQTNDQPIVTLLPVTYFYADENGALVQATERTMAGYSDYDPASQTISIFTKGRGLGDCGSLGFYQTQVSEKKLKLERFLAKNECDGTYVEPIKYPQVYP